MITCSIVVPSRNEVEVIPLLIRELVSLQAALAERQIAAEFVFSDNGSTDDSFDTLLRLSTDLKLVQAFHLARDYGYQDSLLFAMAHCSGDAVCVLQSDLQDPPHLILAFVDDWLDGCTTVGGRAVKRAEWSPMTLTRKIFYGFLGLSSANGVSSGIQDFYLLDRIVVIDLLKNKPADQLIRTFVGEHFGFTKVYEYHRAARVAGSASLSLSDYYTMALDAFLTTSSRGIRALTISSFGLATAASAAACTLVTAYLLGWRPDLVGWLSLMVLLITFIGLSGFAFGITWEYLYRLSRRPSLRAIPTVRSQYSLDKTQILKGNAPGTGSKSG